MRRLLVIPLLLLAVGCFVDRRFISDPARNRVIRVETGDRIYFTLDEPADNPRRWSYSCDDPDVEVRLDHEPGCAEVRLRIGQGYDGPSFIHFQYAREDAEDKDVTSEFTLTCFERTGDAAFWK